MTTPNMKIGIFTHAYFSEVAVNNYRIPAHLAHNGIETNILLADGKVNHGYRVIAEQYTGLNHVWVADSVCLDYSQVSGYMAIYDWIVLCSPWDKLYWETITDKLPNALDGRATNEVLYFPSQLNDCFGEIVSKKNRRFPGNPYTWTTVDFPLTHFAFHRSQLGQISARICPCMAMISSFYLGLLMKNPTVINVGYAIGETVVDSEEPYFTRAMGLLRHELQIKVKAASAITRSRWGYPTPSNLTKKLIWV